MKRSAKVIAMGFLASLLAIIIGLTGCQTLVKKTIEKKTGVEVETEKKTPLKKVDTSDIPDELIYPGSKAEERTKITVPQGESVQVSLTTSDEAEKVEAYYDEEPASAGWSQQVKVEQETIAYSFSKDKSWATVSIDKEDGRTKILVQYVETMK